MMWMLVGLDVSGEDSELNITVVKVYMFPRGSRAVRQGFKGTPYFLFLTFITALDLDQPHCKGHISILYLETGGFMCDGGRFM